MGDARRSTGQSGEALAAAQATAWGWRIRDRNWRCRYGEIDLVAQDGDNLVFVEVRTRRGDVRGTPEESVDRAKQSRLATLAQHYIQTSGWDGPWRIDVIAIILGPDGNALRLTHYPNALEGL